MLTYRRLTASLLCAIFFIGNIPTFSCADQIPPLEPFDSADRVLVISPHPDDDVIACAGVIQRSLGAGAKVRVVYTTCGDNNIFSIFLYTEILSILFSNKLLYLVNLIAFWKDHFISLGNIRMREAINSEKILGLEAKDLVFLGYPDHGTDQMFVFNWDHTKPYNESFGGYSSVPYEYGLGYKKGFTADNIIEDLKKVMADFRPTKIFVAHPSDVNGDHWASYLYAMACLADLGDKMPRPKIYPYLVHVPDWPLPRNYHPQLYIAPPEEFFGEYVDLIDWRQLKLTEEEIEKKHRAMLEHKSQVAISAFYLLAFVRQNEIFGDFPVIKLKRQSSSGQGLKDVFKADMKWVGYAVVDDSLLVRIKTPDDPKKTETTLFFAGFRDDVPFAAMPNILAGIRDKKLRKVYNASTDKEIHPDGAALETGNGSMTFKIPLTVLGNPQGLLFGFETDPDYMPDGCTSFRSIKIE